MLAAILANLNQLNAGGMREKAPDFKKQLLEDEEILKVIIEFIKVHDHGHIDG